MINNVNEHQTQNLNATFKAKPHKFNHYISCSHLKD